MNKEQPHPNAFNPDKYKWRGLNPRLGMGWRFRFLPHLIPGANFREIHFLWFKLTVSWTWNYHSIWNDGWDAHFRQELYKDEIIESTKVRNRKN